ncbi:polymorphic toxin type 44 domain-containing protein [Shewanella sp. D64]|uniref:polymorphic toxin type 44 domain-containing protein n=1 Tax=unclassified Shewanella TaxID=196818 RepID=UPI0022BA52E3|nr:MULTISPECIES: polymorphic toxin type 44 domain-containing protein [unclassified Shewanella]MEC4728573.1 polymorphic toxin type 44 domain-containing protein [Shewanella sp. D64]MEC4740507.1 polymorphic toxin type 44 domain-containing protein [Shewanella sp. E94]WBJ94824.1 polymorphic toxin type 44 domain-containing protein [Shewanella sp. MTB7]
MKDVVEGGIDIVKNLKLAILIPLLFGSGVVHASCTPEQESPAGKPENFNTNKHLKQFDRAGVAASRLPDGGLAVRASVMASMFAPHRKYDLKNNPNYMSSQEFGNWFYGAAAAQMGFNRQEALTAGAIVQQWQNYDNTNHPDAGDVSRLASNIVHAIRTGEGDNLDDAAPIEGGHSYSKDVYENDPDSDSNSDSCDSDDSDDNSSGGGGGEGSYSGGWGSSGSFIGASSCYGSCGGGGGGSVRITDLPAQQPN